MFQRAIAAAVISILVSASAQAALLTGIEGSVSVNRGSGFQVVTVPTQVKPGDRVMVGQGSNAQIVYSDTCIARLPASNTVVVATTVPCTATSPVSTTAPALGLTAPGVGPLVVGGLVVAAGVGAAILLTQGASP